ncbi:Zinc finger DZIP1L [Gossypium arboreum]|uniref:Zinc finger DZIP1L n=1 Tax=Gossypium arboreum TaxID=29729 RepID=A0A0B0NE77_GOSAR|nr:Zinc finger DZIP1L [Gossypium arboreum]
MIISFHIIVISFKITRKTIWNTKGYLISFTREGELLLACSKHGLTLAHMSRPTLCPRHGLTLALISMPMPCPRHGLTLAHISPKCHGMDMQSIPRFNREFTTLVSSYIIDNHIQPYYVK